MKKKTLDVGIDVYLNELLESRLLIQASSGGGKSYMLRVLAEQALPIMPVFILDHEGEFASLREKFDMVLVGTGGDVPCDVKSAAMLARSLVELEVSALVDLSELKVHARQDFVRDFLTSLIELPRKSWPSTKGKAFLVMVDEAHKLCPQKQASVAGPAVIDLQSRGRKRGFVGVLATQRLSKLDKDAAAECGTIFVGRTSQIDAKRACEILGLPAKESHGLTQLRAGDWRAVGSALDPGLQKFRGAKAKTSHAKSGAKLLAPPKPSKKIRGILPRLEKIREQTAADLRTTAEYKKELANVRRELTNERKGKPKPEIRTVDRVLGDPATVEKAVRLRDRIWERWVKAELHPILKRFYEMVSFINKKKPDILNVYPVKPNLPAIETAPPAPAVAPQAPRPAEVSAAPSGDADAHEMKILSAIAWYESVGIEQPARAIVGIMAGYKGGGRFNKLLGGLKSSGLIDYPGNGSLCLTDAGRATAPTQEAPATLADLHRAWSKKLSSHEWRLVVAVMNEPGMTPADLASATSYTVGGRFNKLLGSIRSLGLVTNRGLIEPTNLVYPEGLE